MVGSGHSPLPGLQMITCVTYFIETAYTEDLFFLEDHQAKEKDTPLWPHYNLIAS